MGKLFFGTSSDIAPYLIALGWVGLPMCGSYATARQQACIASIRNLADPVVLSMDVANEPKDGFVSVDPKPNVLQIASVIVGETAIERLGFEEVADASGLIDIVKGLLTTLDESHKLVRNIVDVGAGGTAELPDIERLRDALTNAQNRLGKHRDKLKHVVRKATRQARQQITDEKKLAQKALPAQKAKNLKGADKAKSPVAAKKPAAKTRARPKKNEWSPKQKKNEGLGPLLTAKRDVTIKGKLNGKPHTLNIKSGQGFKAGSDYGGYRVWVPGMHGIFIVNPSDKGKLGVR